MPNVALNSSAQVVLDGSGNGTCKVGPQGHGEVWHPTVASVHVSGTIVNSPVCKIYVGTEATPTTFCDATYTGEQDSTDRVSGSTLWLNYFVWAVWTGGDPGHQATLVVTGTQDVP
jgi:hypothetical protein